MDIFDDFTPPGVPDFPVNSQGIMLEKLKKEYIKLFPDDPDIQWHHFEESVTDKDRISAIEWALANESHFWEYPDIHPELVPGYWEKVYKEHPDWEF